MLVRVAVVTAAAFLLSACASVGITPTPAPVTIPVALSAAQQEIVKTGVRSSLKFPTSPIFGPMKAAKDGAVIYVCGIVNAKNSFGGYVGDQPYIGAIAGDGFTVVGMGGNDTDTTATINVCKRYGII